MNAIELTKEKLGDALYDSIGLALGMDGVIVWERECVLIAVGADEHWKPSKEDLSVIWCAGDMRLAIDAAARSGRKMIVWEREWKAKPDPRVRRMEIAKVRKAIYREYGQRLV